MLLQSTTTTFKVICWIVGSLLGSWYFGATVGMATITCLLVVCLGYITGLQKVEVAEHKTKQRPSCKTRVDKSRKVIHQKWTK